MLDLTMQRMAQIRNTIWERQKQTERKELKVREVELKTLARYIAASAGFQDGVDASDRISLTGEPVRPKKKELNAIPAHMVGKLFG